MLPLNVRDLRPFWDTFRARHPQWQLQIRHASFVDPFAGLRRGDLDMLVCWLPVEEPDPTVGPALFADPRVLAVAAGHELTRRTSVSLEMLVDFQHSDARVEAELLGRGLHPVAHPLRAPDRARPLDTQRRGDSHLGQHLGVRQPLPRPHDALLEPARHRLPARQ
ncbi:LysR family transcriptional regulator substrate-binding protein [Nonomuraea sp. bgisy094]